MSAEDIFVGPSEMAAMMKEHDWTATPVGPVERWPASLKTMIRVILSTRHPMFLWWGPELIQFYNDAYLPSFGRGKHPKALGQPGRECWPEIWPIIGPQIEAVMTAGTPSWHEDQLVPIFRNGRIEDVYWTYGYSPVFNDEGRIAGTLVVCTETTGRVVTEQALRRSEEESQRARDELLSFLMQAPIGVAILSGPQHIYRLVNPPYLEMLFRDRTPESFLGKPIREALPELEGQGFFELLDGVYQTGKPFNGSKHRAFVRRTDGSERELFVNFSYQAKRDHRGQIDGILVVVYEVTDQVNEQREIEQLAENLRAAVVARDNFLGVASHELNTPLTSLKLQADIGRRALKRDPAAFPPDKVLKLLDSTTTQVNRLARLINDMLDVSRISSGKLTMNIKRTNLTALVRETLARFEPQFEAASSSLSADLREEIDADIDASRIDQVVTNLITNALKYAPGKPLHVTVERDGNLARVTLRDEGAGIAFEHQERIFGRYERAITASEVSGLGLGLYICKQIVVAHGGEISVRSEPGTGATFTFDLPVNAGA